jgi:hypothetical protein
MTPTSIASLLRHPARVSAMLLTLSNLFMTFAWHGRAGLFLMGAVYFIFRN